MSIHKTYSYRTTVKVGANHETTIWPRPGLFIYSGLGIGNYYSAAMKVVKCSPADAQGLAAKEGVTYNYQDYESGNFAQYMERDKYPMGVNAHMCSDGSLHESKKDASDWERFLLFMDWYEEEGHRIGEAEAGEAYEWVRFNFDELRRLTQ